MGFDEAKFRRAWRKLCAERGIDPLEGATDAQARKAAHDQRTQALTLAHFARHPEREPRGGIAWRLRADWWTKPEYWYNTPTPRVSFAYTFVPERVPLHSRGGTVEDEAIRNVQRAAAYAKLARMVEAAFNHSRGGTGAPTAGAGIKSAGDCPRAFS